MGLATGSKKTSGALAELVTTYANILAAQVCVCACVCVCVCVIWHVGFCVCGCVPL